MLFDSWVSLGRVAMVGALAYVSLVLLLRISGKRTLSKMNAFDFVVTVALGSTLATVVLSKSVALADGATAFVVLIGLQFVATWGSVRSETVRRMLKSEPAVLFSQGQFHWAAMRRERVTQDELEAAARQAGHGSMDSVGAVVLETDASFSVLTEG